MIDGKGFLHDRAGGTGRLPSGLPGFGFFGGFRFSGRCRITGRFHRLAIGPHSLPVLRRTPFPSTLRFPVISAVLFSHGKRNSVSFLVDAEHPHLYLLPDLDRFPRVLDETVHELADMHEPVEVDPDIHERAEVGDVGYDAVEPHPLLDLVDGMDPFGILNGLELIARIAPGPCQFLQDVLQGRQPHVSLT